MGAGPARHAIRGTGAAADRSQRHRRRRRAATSLARRGGDAHGGKARDWRRAAIGVGITVRVRERRRRRGWESVVLHLMDMDGDGVADEGPSKPGNAVWVGTVIHPIARRQEQLGGAWDVVRVGRPGEQAKQRHVLPGACLRRQILDETERGEQVLDGGA